MTGFRVFEATPGLSILLAPDAPIYSIVTVTDDFVRFTGRDRNAVIGKSHFAFFNETVQQQFITCKEKLEESLQYVIRNKVTHEMPSRVLLYGT